MAAAGWQHRQFQGRRGWRGGLDNARCKQGASCQLHCNRGKHTFRATPAYHGRNLTNRRKISPLVLLRLRYEDLLNGRILQNGSERRIGLRGVEFLVTLVLRLAEI